MKNPVSKTIVTLAVSMATSAMAFSAVNAAEGDNELTGLGKARQIIVQKNNKNDNVVAQLDKEPIKQQIVIVDKDKAKTKNPVIDIVDKEEKAKKRPLPQIDIVDKQPPVIEDDEDETPIIKEQAEKTPQIIDDEDFAPKVEEKKKTAQIPMPSIFTEKQKRLYEELSVEEQVKLVRRLIKKYGYDTLYPRKVASNTYDSHYTYKKPRYFKKRHHGYERDYSYSHSYSNSYNYSNDYNSYSSSYGCRR